MGSLRNALIMDLVCVCVCMCVRVRVCVCLSVCCLFDLLFMIRVIFPIVCGKRLNFVVCGWLVFRLLGGFGWFVACRMVWRCFVGLRLAGWFVGSWVVYSCRCGLRMVRWYEFFVFPGWVVCRLVGGV